MEKFVVVTFPTQEKAYEGVRALKELDAEGSLSLYGMEVVGRDSAGVLHVKQVADAGPIGMGVGALLGGLFGLLGGPVGAAVGFSGGALIGGTSDLVNSGISSSFVEEVSSKLTPGKTAIIAEVDEEWITPLDTRMESLGADVLREWSIDVEDEYYEAQIAARKAEMAQLKAEFAQANQEGRAKLQAKIEKANANFEAALDKAEERLEAHQQATGAKIKVLSDRAARARSDTRVAMDQRIATLREEYTKRQAKLAQAQELARQSDKLAVEALIR